MDFRTWLQKVISTGNLCDVYKEKALDATSKLALMRLCLDANGCSYLCEMQAKGYPLSYETIKREFNAYINGRYVAEYKNERNNGYTSAIYCNVDDIKVNTTLTTIMGCKCDVWVGENDFVRLYVDSNSDIVLHIPKSSRCIIEYWGDAKIRELDCDGKVELIKH